MVKLSKPGKMPCKSWSLPAVDTCPGARAPGGGLVDACRGCYATTGNYRFPNVKAPREHNREDWKRAGWVADMVAAIGDAEYFRWFDSGDVYDVRLAHKIGDVIAATPHCQHWLPTRSHKYSKFIKPLKLIAKNYNAVVRLSSDCIRGGVIPGENTSVIFDPEQGAPDGVTVCPAYSQDGKCGDCRACWDKSIQVIAYPQHGRNMAAVNKNIIASTN